MAAATVSKRYICSLGPVKAEVIQLSAAVDTNTIVSQLASPQFGFAVNNEDGDATTVTLNVAISGRTVTLNQASLDSADVVVILVGF